MQVYISLIDDVSVVKCWKNDSLVRILIWIIGLITSDINRWCYKSLNALLVFPTDIKDRYFKNRQDRDTESKRTDRPRRNQSGTPEKTAANWIIIIGIADKNHVWGSVRHLRNGDPWPNSWLSYLLYLIMRDHRDMWKVSSMLG